MSIWMRAALVASAGGALSLLALRSSPYLGEVGWLPAWVGEIADRFGVLRNVPAFGLMFLIVAIGLGRRSGWMALAATVVFAASLELSQLSIPGRVSDPKDILASWLGATVGFGVWRGVGWWRRSHQGLRPEI